MKKTIFTILFIWIFIFSSGNIFAKNADLAGSWYSSSPKELRTEIEGYLQKVKPGKLGGRLIGAIAPHAGFRYSGLVAANTFKAIENRNPKKVIVVGFSHRRYYPGKISIFTDAEFTTPLGAAKIDTSLTRKILESSGNIESLPEAFRGENSVEMMIPFLQVAVPEAELVLIAITDQNKETCSILADVLHEALKTEEDFVLLASSDMCHYLSYSVANKVDKETIKSIKAFDPDKYFESERKLKRNEGMCGQGAVFTVMEVSKKFGANDVKVLKYANSGDAQAGSKDAVVGYVSALFIETGAGEITPIKEKEKENDMFSDAQKKELLLLARNTIDHYLKTGQKLTPKTQDEALKEDMGAFVTLHKKGALRGCIGHMVATGPLDITVRDMAIAAATEDPRFPRMRSPEEMNDVDLEISVLTPMRQIEDYEEIEMGKHGVMVKTGFRSGVYLPQVADETGWTREEFMSSLCAHKAGISSDAWKKGECDIYIFTAEVFGEKDLD